MKKNSVKFKNKCAQGDVFIQKIKKLPANLKKVEPEGDKIIVTHSETGHHHLMEAEDVEMYMDPNNPLIAFLEVEKPTELVHMRSFDTHKPILFDKGTYQINRQQEFGVEGWKKVTD